MCGFFGQFNQQNLPESEFKSLLALAQRRGPDDSGYYEGENFQFGFNRLSIIDVSPAGHQPMTSPNANFVLMFNGEVYNHLELRSQLPKINYRGHSDTETICHALEVWGIEKTIKALDGMFALAIYEFSSKNLYLARDFAGIKPLFYGNINGSIVFGSQYDQILAHPKCNNLEIDLSVLKLYLKQHFMPAPFGIHKGMNQLHPGEIIRFSNNGNIEKIRYWELPDELDSNLIHSQDEAQALFHDAFRKSIKDQLVSDVPLGAFLSGGVDSSLVCAFAKKEKKDLEVFTIGSDSKTHDESERSKRFAEALNFQQHLWKLDGSEMLSFWEDAMSAIHEPLADFSILPTYLVSKLAKKHVTVSLSGDGGDELFFGYERFWSLGKNIQYHDYPNFLRKGIYGIDKVLTKNKNVNSLLTLPNQSTAHEGLHSRFSDNRINRLFPDLRNVNTPDKWKVYSYSNQSNDRLLMTKMRKAEFYGMMQKTLRKVDLASMENSLEVRVPFLQKSFIEAALKIDPMLSYGKNKKKQVLKDAQLKMYPKLEDDNIKRGFTVPLGNWIKGELGNVLKENFNQYDNSGLVNKKEAVRMLQSHQEGSDLKWPLFTTYALLKFV
jgi:asparagine synthase (glutamine-hydrolysing)